MTVPRSEYPRPQFVREDWMCLNGKWQFEIDQGDSGRERGLCERELDRKIVVPFCPESELSGIGHTDFINAVWYRKDVDIPQDWSGKDVLLHFQAVDYDATVWVNGTEVFRHRGGFSPFTCNLAGVAEPGKKATIVVRARDLHNSSRPGGKQSNHCYENRGCHYTRTTGIWQTVWLEPVPKVHLKRPRITPDVANSSFIVVVPVSNNKPGQKVRVTLFADGAEVVSKEVLADADLAPQLLLAVPADKVRLWSIEDPFLYDLKLELIDADGVVVDSATSYAGLRGITIDGQKVLINGKPVFQRLVLDQGYYADGIMTAPSDDALKQDIVLSMEAGFNGARLHQKVFEERFLYHADQLGYLVWGEFGDWGLDRSNQSATIVAEWLTVLERDYSHPSIIGWCPLNETRQDITDQIVPLDDITHAMYLATKAMDTTRPVLDSSGYSHRVRGADIYDCHDYDQNPETFRERHAGTPDGIVYINGRNEERGSEWSIPYAGQPYFVSEFGGIKWNPAAADSKESWGYGNTPKDLEEFYDRFEKLCGVLLDNPGMFAYCYTQLTDVFQEQNGVLNFDRTPKFDMARLRAAQQKTAAIEDA